MSARGPRRGATTEPDLARPAGDPEEESIGALFGRLAEDGRAYAKAEIDVYRRSRGIARRGRAAALVALVAGVVLLVSSMTALVFGRCCGSPA